MEKKKRHKSLQELPDAYVIFVCDFDPFGSEKYRYTFCNQCEEVKELKLRDGSHTIFLSTKGKDETEISESLKKFLGFVKADLEESCVDFDDPYVKTLQNSIQEIKRSREMGDQYMIFEEMMRDERKEGKTEMAQEFILELLQDIGAVTEEIVEKIEEIEDITILRVLFQKAKRADSIEQFLKESEEIFASYKKE